MPSVTLTVDLYRLLASQPDGLTVETIADYVPACAAIRRALHESTSMASHIRVHDAMAAAWLRALAEAYGDDWIAVNQYTAREALGKRWNISVPSTVRDQDILQSRLLDDQVTPRAGQSFEDVLLEHYYGDALAYPAFPLERLAALLNEYDKSRWQANEHRPLIVRAYRERLAAWERAESNESRRWLIAQLRADPDSLRANLASWKLLHTYPGSLADKVLGQAASHLLSARVDVEPLAIAGLDLSTTITEIEYYLSAARSKVSTSDDLIALLDLMSGNLAVELNVIESLLKEHSDWLTPQLFHQIEQRFLPIREGIGTRLAALGRLIPPAYPTPPDAHWTVAEWLGWVRDSYMPYLRWLESQRRYDEQVASYAASFADWYYDHFVELKNSAPEHFAFSALYLDRERFMQGDAIGLVILLDNFNYAHLADLRRLFNQRDLTLTEDRPTLSLIPTSTDIGKPALVMTTGDQTDVPDVNYSVQVQQAWGAMLRLAGKSVAYLSKVGELQQLAERKHDLYFLNYRPIDDALHSNAQETGQEHAVVIHSYLEQLVASVVEFAKRFRIEQRLLVYIVSDHGSTRIGKDVVNVLDHKFFKGMALDKHHRYIAISDEQLAALPQVAQAQCYVIDRQRFKTNHNYLAARRYYRFAETSEDFYVHGGLTPEEVVVPFARFELKPISVLPPTLRLMSDQFRYAIKSTVEFELGNPNEYALENVRVNLVSLGSEESYTNVLGQKQTVQIRVALVFKKEPGVGNSRELIARVQYECQEHSYGPVDIKFTITLKPLMEVRDDLDL